jgi:hypothetical protein
LISACIAPEDASALAPPPGSCARRMSNESAARTDASAACVGEAIGQSNVLPVKR